ncbi:HepT-like ribonuclease domain-containing protein [Cyanobacterium sp. DS4]|uniref:HepT-like ribonuclease domain-containing protein n=1 Tax=Cyanobacterium sp. DS4 TaxID=2878255 RepID=UPI002E81D1CD|nr:HepT-like ribonuclease domain-containing protein [Cyanobacterium sp. Dongsha4]WVL01977.1 DUF86 domain-containing protein [Cyanobacterium sp. Dongsha4]
MLFFGICGNRVKELFFLPKIPHGKNTAIISILLQSAIERQLEILGEAARRISDDFQQENKQIPWSDIIGQRNIIAHQYEKVNQKRIWQVITVDIPNLVIELEKIIPPMPPEI